MDCNQPGQTVAFWDIWGSGHHAQSRTLQGCCGVPTFDLTHPFINFLSAKANSTEETACHTSCVGQTTQARATHRWSGTTLNKTFKKRSLERSCCNDLGTRRVRFIAGSLARNAIETFQNGLEPKQGRENGPNQHKPKQIKREGRFCVLLAQVS